MSTKQRCVHRSNTCCQTLKHFDNVISTCCENVVEVFESLFCLCDLTAIESVNIQFNTLRQNYIMVCTSGIITVDEAQVCKEHTYIK